MVVVWGVRGCGGGSPRSGRQPRFRLWAGSGCFGFDGDVEAEGFELGDEAALAGCAGTSFLEVVAAQVGVGLTC